MVLKYWCLLSLSNPLELNSLLLHRWLKKKTGYKFYKKSLIKSSVIQSLQHGINIPEANSKELEIIRFLGFSKFAILILSLIKEVAFSINLQ